MSEAQEAVKRGAAWLDKKKPGWHREINLKDFNILSCDYCILGQLYGEYGEARNRLAHTNGEEKAMRWALRRGFTTTQADYDAEDLQSEWVAEIKRRRSKERFKKRISPL